MSQVSELAQGTVSKVFKAVIDAQHNRMHRLWTTRMYLDFIGAFREEVINKRSMYWQVRKRKVVVRSEGLKADKVVPVKA